MTDTAIPTAVTKPWTVIIWPEWYDDPSDHGYGWDGDATGEMDAVRQACEACEASNDVDRADPDDEHRWLDPETVEYTDCHLNYQALFERLAGAARTYLDKTPAPASRKGMALRMALWDAARSAS